MARYWWQCISCGYRPAWLTVCHSRAFNPVPCLE